MLMRRALLVLLASTMAAGCASSSDRSAGFAPDPYASTATEAPVSLTFESTGGGGLPTFVSGGAMYVAGEQGQRYNLRLTNNTASRVEAVVSVDGRDVISGEVGNYKKQRGYVIEPFSSVVVDGFRQSLDQVAAFRFTHFGDSYSARRGSAQNVGVVGVAVFSEKPSRKKTQQFAVAPRPYYEGQGQQPPPPEPFPAAGKSAPSSAPGDGEFADDSAPSAEADVAESASAPPSQERAHHELGTQYGESQYSAVDQVAFKRKRRRKPDAFLTIYYDSFEGLEARGVTGRVPTANGPTIAR